MIHSGRVCRSPRVRALAVRPGVVIAKDDQLNLPVDVKKLRKAHKEPRLLVIPYGGHLGMCGTKWFQTLMSKVFAAK